MTEKIIAENSSHATIYTDRFIKKCLKSENYVKILLESNKMYVEKVIFKVP